MAFTKSTRWQYVCTQVNWPWWPKDALRLKTCKKYFALNYNDYGLFNKKKKKVEYA